MLRATLKKAAEAAFRLDKEMSSIRDESSMQQKFFEDKSPIWFRVVLSSIQELYYYPSHQGAACVSVSYSPAMGEK